MCYPPIASLVTCAIVCSTAVLAAPGAEFATTKEGIVGTYRKAVPEESFDAAKARDEKNKPRVMQRQRALLEERYDLADRPSNLVLGLRLTEREKVALVAYMRQL
jgi:cytochrome c peroxidase